MKKHFISSFKGMMIGASMLIPGVSGGTMALILNIYDDLLTAVSHFFKDIKKNLLFLSIFSLGGLIGIFLFSGIILDLTERYRFPMLSFFMGAILGGLPMLMVKSKDKAGKLHWYQILYALIGIGIIALMSLKLNDLFVTDPAGGTAYIITLVAAGILCAFALILPGISLSYMLLVMDLYEPTMTAISELDFAFLIPMGIGLAGGTILIVKALEKALTNSPHITYPIITGFLLGSLPEVFPGIPSGINWLLCPLALAVGFGAVLLLSRLSGETSTDE